MDSLGGGWVGGEGVLLLLHINVHGTPGGVRDNAPKVPEKTNETLTYSPKEGSGADGQTTREHKKKGHTSKNHQDGKAKSRNKELKEDTIDLQEHLNPLVSSSYKQ